MVLFLLFVGLIYSVDGALEPWNPTNGPSVPLQPMEVGYQENMNSIRQDRDNSNLIYQQITTNYIYSSYSLSRSLTTSTGRVNDEPFMTIAYNNYNNDVPNSGNGLLVQYSYQTCVEQPVEDKSSLVSYDFYSKLINSVYAAGSDVTYEYLTVPDFGLCLHYHTVTSFYNTVFDLYFQNSTGYLVEYDIHSTMYCCNTDGYQFCQLQTIQCSDGSNPQVITSQSNETYSNYQLFTASQWPTDFFIGSCPFDATPPVSDDSTNCNGNNAMGLTTILSIVFGGLFGIVAIITLILIYQLRLLKSNQIDTNPTIKTPLV